jgi:hypothetical protein
MKKTEEFIYLGEEMTKPQRDAHWNSFRIMYNRYRSTNIFNRMMEKELIAYVEKNPKNKDAWDEYYYRKLWDSKEGRKKLGDQEDV